MKQQFNTRLSDPARRKLAALTERYGSQTIVCEVAIDRLYRQEIKMETDARLNKFVTPEDLFDAYAGKTATAQDIAAQSLDTVIRQVRELIDEEGYEDFGLTPEEIGKRIRDYALFCIMALATWR